jgi:hypothetical protein
VISATASWGETKDRAVSSVVNSASAKTGVQLAYYEGRSGFKMASPSLTSGVVKVRQLAQRYSLTADDELTAFDASAWEWNDVGSSSGANCCRVPLQNSSHRF